LFFSFPKDTIAIKQNETYLYGNDILVAPVMEKGAIEKEVYLPKGNWYNAERNEFFSGEKLYMLNVEEYKKAVFYKEGSFIPTYNCDGENTTEIRRENLNVLYTPSSQKSAYEMYDDDGENANALKSKQFELISFSSNGVNEKGVNIILKSNNWQYKNKPIQRNISLSIPLLSKPVKQVIINNLPIKNYISVNNILQIPVVLKKQPVNIEVKF
jgi:oligosaccharide 4-alpha-D-glucosyltransferase